MPAKTLITRLRDCDKAAPVHPDEQRWDPEVSPGRRSHHLDRIRKELAELGDSTLLITERGRPLAVTISVDRWNDLQGYVEELEDAIAIIEHRLSKGSGTPAEVVLADIEAEEVDLSSPAGRTG